MSSPVKYYCFAQDLGRGVHNLNTATLKIALTNTAPNVATHTVLADITEISAGNGYSAGGTAVGSTAYSQSGGVGKLTGNDVVISATGGGAFGPARYAVLYNSSVAGGPLIQYWDKGASVTSLDPDTFTVDVDPTNGILQVT